MRLANILTLAAIATLAACSNNDNPLNPPIGQLRVANAISDSSTVQSSVESVSANDTLAFGQVTGEHDLFDGNYLVHLTANSASLPSQTFDANPVNIDKNHITTVFAVGSMADGSENSFIVEESDTDVPSTKSEVQFVDVAYLHQDAVDIYVTAPGASLVGQTPVTGTSGLTFKSNTAQMLDTFAPGTYEIRVTPHNVPATILFDTGPAGIQFPGQATEQFVLIDHTGGGSPFSLLVIVGSGSSHIVENGSS